jgi:mRNA interferase RelE/StbE
MKLVLKKDAIKGLVRMQPKVATAIRTSLEKIAADPFGKHANAKPLQGTKAGYRLRHGDWRVVYRIDRATETVLVEAVKPQGKVYK